MFKGFVAFMVVALKHSIPSVVQAISEVIFYEQWLVKKSSDNIDKLIEIGLCVQRIVTENHLSNVNVFSALIKIFNSALNYYIKYQQNSCKTYLFYDIVYLPKIIRKNLLSNNKLVFLELHIKIISPASYIHWGDLYIFEKDKELKSNLRKAAMFLELWLEQLD